MTGASDDLRKRVVNKVTLRIIPFIFLCYVVAYLDRVNIGMAEGLQADLKLTDGQLGWGGGLFFLGYFLFEVPSNLILHRVGARVWIARIMIVWGLVSMATIWVSGKWSFYGMRVLLGLAEAGFFPGIVLYLTYWVPARERARMGALFMIAAPVAVGIGSPLSGLLLRLQDLAGLKGWQWLFLLEGLPAVILGLITLGWLTSRPEDASWLAQDERDWLARELDRERTSKPPPGHAPIRESLRNPKVWVLCFFYFLNTTVTYGIFLWLPKILGAVSGAKDLQLGLLSGSTLLPAIAGMVLVTAHSDRTGERRWHAAACCGVAILGLVLTVVSGHSTSLVWASLVVCHLGQRTIQAVFWSIPPVFLGGAAAAAGIAFINSIGNLGGYLGPWAMGRLKESTGSFNTGLLLLAGVLLVEAIVVLSLRMPPKVEVA
ncbi:MAG TPA: MFS transporter [Planctomycetota bacterium]|nr:MFS transporter [Planctomycetota bacterium]